IPDFIAPKILTMLDASIIQDTQERVWGAQKTFNINRELICGSNTREIDNFIESELKQHNITKPYFFEHQKKSS
ncbi:MAG: hypothetical protein KKI14_01015, partial [Nanoarchaeota archaeon]|nr:hypothetical protein [Nanoarchaeota archaeon]